MLPVLLDLKFVKIYTFGIFLVLAFFWGTFLLWRSLRLSSYREEDAFDGLFLALAGGLFVSRLVYVILNFQKFGFNFCLHKIYRSLYSQPGCQDLALRQSSTNACSHVLPLSSTSSESCGAWCATIAICLPS